MHVISRDYKGTIRLWDVRSGQVICSFQGQAGSWNRLAFSPDGQYIVGGSADGTVTLWDSQTGRIIGEPFVGPTDTVNSVAFAPGGKQIMTATEYGVIYIWNINGRRAFDGHTGRITTTVISSDVILSASTDDNTVRFWDQDVLPIDLSLVGDTKGILVMSISPDETRTATVSMNNTISLWNLATRQLVCAPMKNPITGFTSSLSLRFSPDSTRLILACIDGTICAWNAADGSPAGVSPPPSHDRKAIAFDLKRGWSNDTDQSDSQTLMRWIPFDNPDAGVWAFVDGNLIRSNGSGSLTIIDTQEDTSQSA